MSFSLFLAARLRRHRTISSARNWQAQSGTAHFDGVVASNLARRRRRQQRRRKNVGACGKIAANRAGRHSEQFYVDTRARSLGLGRAHGQQCLAAGMPQAIQQGGMGQCPAHVSGGRQTSRPGRRRRCRAYASAMPHRSTSRFCSGPSRRHDRGDARLWHAPQAGGIGTGVGVDFYPLRTAESPWVNNGVESHPHRPQ